jgi:pyruvate formate lyase activating enzyme
MENGKVQYTFYNCTGCDECIKACPKLSSPRLLSLSSTEILSDIKKRKDYIRGVTFSGGEATLHYKSLIPLIRKIKSLNLTVLIDTNGNFVIDDDFMVFLELVDGFMVDLKFLDKKLHQEYTGVDNSAILKNIEILYSLGKLEEVRTVLYEKPNNTAEIKKISSNIVPKDILYKIIPYHTYGVRFEYRNLFEVPTKKTIEEIKMYLQNQHRQYKIIQKP